LRRFFTGGIASLLFGMKKIVRTLLGPLKPLLEAIAQREAALAVWWARSAHRRLYRIQWNLPPQPEHFDHHIDLYYQWPASRNSFWVERGVFSSLALKPGGELLELACGDGFNARYFYSQRCREVVACDFDPKAVATARRKNRAPNVAYVLADIRTAMPVGKFDNIVWDAAIEHFTPTEIAALLMAIRARLKPAGILSGYTIVESVEGEKALSHHEYEFKHKEDLRRFLSPHFSHVTVFETVHPARHNLYFWASDGGLPFDPEWTHACWQ
jgi:ubiquinone/menaquinone biosynthesis C-methylase UbiE